MGEISKSSPARRTSRMLLGILALALLPWGAAALALSGVTQPARAETGIQFRDQDLYMAVSVAGDWQFVKIDMLMADDGVSDFAAAVDQARIEMLGRFPGAVEIPEGVAAQYVTNGYWWAAKTAAWSYNASGKPGTLGGDTAAIQGGAAAWGTVGAAFSFTGGGTTTSGTGACSGSTDGKNTVGWAPQSGSILAVTCSWFSSTGSPFKNAVEFDMQFDPDWSWTTGSPIQVDLQSVATHEFGHALGLGHSAQTAAVMYASYPSGSNKRTPQADDISGIVAIYGASGGGPAPTNTPTPVPSSSPSPSPSGTATPTRTPTSTPTPGGGSPSPTNTPLPTATPTNTPGSTATPTNTPTPGSGGPTSTSTPVPSATITPAPPPPSTPPPSLPLLPGANLLAWPGGDVAPSLALTGPGSTALLMVYSYDPASGSWLRFGPGLPAYVNTLRLLKKGQAYWFIATAPGQVAYVP